MVRESVVQAGRVCGS